MEKYIEIYPGEYFTEKIKKPVRNKQDIILLLLETIKIIIDHVEDHTEGQSKVILCKDKMSRVFYETKDKYFSIGFPFYIEKKNGSYRIYDKITELEIDSRRLSMLIRIFSSESHMSQSLESMIDDILEVAEDYEYQNINEVWYLVFLLWHMEEGYIRYDYDPIYEKARSHPLNHLDINYSSDITYKIGMNRKISIKAFMNILDIKEECAFLAG